MQGFEKLQSAVWIGGLAGVIPFYASIAGLIWLEWPFWAFLGYAWLILAFLCGVVWRSSLDNAAAPGAPQGLLLALLLPAALWLSYFTTPVLQLGLSAAGFVAVYLWERNFAWGSYPAGYRVLRTVLTTLVVSAHIIMLAL